MFEIGWAIHLKSEVVTYFEWSPLFFAYQDEKWHNVQIKQIKDDKMRQLREVRLQSKAIKDITNGYPLI